MKKPGFYLSEESYVSDIYEALNYERGNRYPLTYIMEAADDISYCLADIEDAVEKNILSLEKLSELLLKAYGVVGDVNEKSFKGGKASFKSIVDGALKKSEEEKINKAHEYFIYLRVNFIHELVGHASQRFVDNLEDIFIGRFNEALLEDDSCFHFVVKAFKDVAVKNVFNHPEVQTLELQGYKIISGILDIYKPLLTLDMKEFSKLVVGDAKGLEIEYRLYKRLAKKHVKAYQRAVEGLDDETSKPLWERYYRSRMLQDWLSGMTDQYAYDEYKLLSVS